MMTDSYFLEIITPYKKFYSDDVQMISLTTPDGEVGILKGHMPLVAVVAIDHDHVIIFADTAEWPEEIDANRAAAAAERAKEKLQSQLSKIEYTVFNAALQRAMARLKIKNKYGR